ncbi:YgdI/YgdR family lipoprotein [Pseudomonas profundi]|uniref:YgdI/YgdR family lipoprotein n=1 Tax=Pseudomonas profundi TaxID=1981513 RepID=UPI001CC26A4D|nr:YgdI/YgdR family lipoprotein [Pseudomonas profundi]
MAVTIYHEETPMKKGLFAIFCAFGLLTLAGCANEHIISTHDGRLIEAENKPEIDEDTGLIEYEDKDGRYNQIPQSEVSEIQER